MDESRKRRRSGSRKVGPAAAAADAAAAAADSAAAAAAAAPPAAVSDAAVKAAVHEELLAMWPVTDLSMKALRQAVEKRLGVSLLSARSVIREALQEFYKRRKEAETHRSWFGKAMGFEETTYHETKARLAKSRGGGRTRPTLCGHGIGEFHFISLAELRKQAAAACAKTARCIRGDPQFVLSNVVGEAKELHCRAESHGAVFQVASQFNCLEFITDTKIPEDGITAYQYDKTQGPICAMCCAAACAYRNYLVRMPDGAVGQTEHNQLNGLAAVQEALGGQYFTVRNGYTSGTAGSLRQLRVRLRSLGEEGRRKLQDSIHFGVQYNCDVTAEEAEKTGLRVTQVFCSALSVSYSRLSGALWEPFARLVLEAAYEATVYAAMCARARNISQKGPVKLYLTKLGDGAFGNEPDWVADSVERGFARARAQLIRSGGGCGVHASLVHYLTIDAENFGYLDSVFVRTDLSDTEPDEPPPKRRRAAAPNPWATAVRALQSEPAAPRAAAAAALLRIVDMASRPGKQGRLSCGTVAYKEKLVPCPSHTLVLEALGWKRASVGGADLWILDKATAPKISKKCRGDLESLVP
eukprot:TRINITY_DN4859_c0_g1_i1.p1 TRINITY_DN4859_c0_g1~~TRINITY_DN4859_c0_g1_i1.p1  ORF type:complete len:597 (+),score=219.41 TRINITY_DN4859_c0_g1_i1:44-1792(+)